jgi:hypothetical protein
VRKGCKCIALIQESDTVEQGPRLDVMYLLTNDKTVWMDGLVAELREDGWSTIRSSNDLELDQTQMDVGMAVSLLQFLCQVV